MTQANGNGSASAQTSGNATPDESDGGPIWRETRRRLLEWYEKEYCASKMTLAILGRESLDKLTSPAVKHFSPILTRNEGAIIPAKRGLGRLEQESAIICLKCEVNGLHRTKAAHISWFLRDSNSSSSSGSQQAMSMICDTIMV
ncbi:hypothetical protein BOTBODRAFT_51487 [Botryobasidium botryosum FD-172 SS1]|uniref:Peptidase M16 C-terminal domain-containing protein n=1 Tax=Botryobasidium botryosum (strain FD-172 SS1) TaxID=930990 RepID=A0A067MX04_BOTB1|nr:hypothetical protein BOTBODRAFT_51487 [Botryobasidium botryosum FD-172 SS1]